MTRFTNDHLCFEPAEYERPKLIRSLQISTPLHCLKTEDFEKLTFLEELILVPNFSDYADSQSWPDIIAPTLFRDMKRLRKLRILGKVIKVLPEDTFKGLENLVHLDLGGNQIRDIRANAFRGLPKLSTLCLNHNSLGELRKPFFEGLRELTRLDLSGNRIATIETGTFHSNKNLLSLNLSHNKLCSFNADAFLGLGGLNALSLKGNPLTEVDEYCFARLDKQAVIVADRAFENRSFSLYQ